MDRKKAMELSKKFPNKLCVHPRESFESQLTQFLIKYCEVK